MGKDNTAIIEKIKELLRRNDIKTEDETETFQELKKRGYKLTRRVAVPKEKEDPDHGSIFIIMALKDADGNIIDDEQIVIKQA